MIIVDDKQTILQSFVERLAFGGGIKNGGLGKKAMNLLKPIFSFDYMGSSEFEWGAVPEALDKISSNHKDYMKFTISIDMKDVKKNYRRTDSKIKKEKLTPQSKDFKSIYVICNKNIQKEVETYIRKLAEGNNTIRLKESSMLDNSLDPVEDYDGQIQGWLELDNGFMFFLDKEMYDKTIKLFSI